LIIEAITANTAAVTFLHNLIFVPTAVVGLHVSAGQGITEVAKSVLSMGRSKPLLAHDFAG
tara:strand:+ start:226 stop:408 length:183 start_codon:yes stop_codon:yes gene_type:complete